MTDRKDGRYNRVKQQLIDLFLDSDEIMSRMATINAVLYHKMDGFFWVGFYLLKKDKLLVGPYQGPLACLELPSNKGVCWKVINTGKTIVVPDVHKYPGHIACDSRSKSEIVLPVRDASNLITGVLDIDSNLINNFNDVDAGHLETIANMLFQNHDLL